MRKLILAAGVAALAITAPVIGEARQGRWTGRRQWRSGSSPGAVAVEAARRPNAVAAVAASRRSVPNAAVAVNAGPARRDGAAVAVNVRRSAWSVAVVTNVRHSVSTDAVAASADSPTSSPTATSGRSSSG